MQVAAIIVAAGRGTRMGGSEPKQYLRLGGRSVLAHTLSAFTAHPLIRNVVVVIHREDGAAFAQALAEADNPQGIPVVPCNGGDARQQSVALGLDALSSTGFSDDGIVLIHDAARPFVPQQMITRAIAAADDHGAAVPVLTTADSVARSGPDGTILTYEDRAQLRAVQTPQAFKLGLIRSAHAEATRRSFAAVTDDAALVLWQGNAVATFPGSDEAFKLTTPEDLDRAASKVAGRLTDLRSATGYDVHAFGPGDHIMLGGIPIAHDMGVIGHSDADVLLHAITDALLGCIADGDIGQHFPPSDPEWKGAASHIFLREAVRRVTMLGGVVRHLDATIIAELPKIGPHRDRLRASIAEIVGVPMGRVSVKATTSERLGFTGRREGIAAIATATVALPEERA